MGLSYVIVANIVRGTVNLHCPPWSGTVVTTCMSYLTTGAPGKEGGTDKLPPMEEFGKDQKERGDFSPYVLPASQNPSRWNPSWQSDAGTTRKDPESE